jgi:hypothetical protein
MFRIVAVGADDEGEYWHRTAPPGSTRTRCANGKGRPEAALSTYVMCPVTEA